MKGKVSVIIPTYKGEKMIGKAIRSVIKQTYDNIELIVVDDNGLGSESQKATEKIVGGFKDERIIYVPHKKNCNGACARNTGLKRATGEFVCFHDDDDLMLPDRIEKCVEILEKNVEVGGVLTDVLCCDQRMTPVRLVEIRKDGDCTRELFTDGMFLGSGSNIFVRKSIADAIGGFDEDFARHQDVEYMIRFYRIARTQATREIGIIKSKNGTVNIPDYPKFRKNEDLFIKKFQDDINKLDDVDRKKFYSDVEYWITLSRALYDKNLLRFLRDMRSLKLKDKALVLALKTKVDKKKLFNWVVRMMRRKNGLKIPKRVVIFLGEYE